ncbi:hypothetical protein GCM10018775_45320 [Streptomyces umbrinus]|nr:hypothetical protein GCM10018775_45320 [Streptomyces umbrinus]
MGSILPQYPVGNADHPCAPGVGDGSDAFLLGVDMTEADSLAFPAHSQDT